MNRLRQYRTSLGLSQSALAARMRVPVKTLQNWEQGRTPVPGLVWAWIELAEEVRDLKQRVEAWSLAALAAQDMQALEMQLTR